MKRVLILVLVYMFFYSCKNVDRKEGNHSIKLTDNQPYRCGIFYSYLFTDFTEQQIYPDLGLVLANHSNLRIKQQTRKALAMQAKECHQLCTIKKNSLRKTQEQLKAKIKKLKGRRAIKYLAKKINDFDNNKNIWLREHRSRYLQGLKLLSPDSLIRWMKIERQTLPFDLD